MFEHRECIGPDPDGHTRTGAGFSKYKFCDSKYSSAITRSGSRECSLKLSSGSQHHPRWWSGECPRAGRGERGELLNPVPPVVRQVLPPVVDDSDRYTVEKFRKNEDKSPAPAGQRAGAGGAESGRPAPPTAALGPGFRFHPTDEELVGYYLKRKITGKPLRFDCIAEIDLYKFDPWDLPEQSLLKTRDLEWYFYTALDKKYGHGSRTNRATGQGYWKTTGKDHPVVHQTHVVGLRKTLVYHTGRAPNGERTNWVMHEYRLEDEELVQAGISQDACVLCRVFQKSGAGPKNGEQYGAPFIEEEWEDEMHGIDLRNLNTDDNTTEGVGCLGVDALNATTSKDFHLQQMRQPVKITSQTDSLTLGLTDSNPQLHMPQPCLNEQMLMKENDNATCHVKFPDEDYIEMNDVITPMNVGCSSYLNDEMFNCNVNDENTLNEFLSVDESFLQQDDLIGLGGLDLVDEIEILKQMSDGDDNLQTCSPLNTFSLSPHLSGITEIPVTAQASQDHDIAGPSSSKRKANSSHNGFKEKAIGDSEFIECPDAADIWNKDFSDGWGKPLAKRLQGMLGLIPSSPAFAAESPFKGKAKVMEHESGVALAGPSHIQAGIFHVGDNCMAHLIPQNWLLTKEGITQERFLITCATESPIRNQKVATFSLFQSGFFLCFMWVVLFAIGVKIGVCVYAR